MDDLGLPMSFGKQSAAPAAAAAAAAPPPPPINTPAEASSSSSVPRGESSSRGPRGVVGGGKKNRGGRGRGAHPGVDSGWAGRAAALSADVNEGLNEGVKRPHPSNPDGPSRFGHLPARPDAPIHGYDSGWGGAGRGRGGGGDGRGGRGGGRGGRGGRGFGGGRGGAGGGHGGGRNDGEAEGFFKPSMCEDPWQPLVDRQQRAERAS